MAFLYRYSIRYPRRVVVIAVVIAAAIAPGGLRLELRTDGHALVPADAPEIRFDDSIRRQFDIEDPIVVVIRSDHPDGIFNGHTLQLVQDLTAEFRRIEGVSASSLFSLDTEHNLRVKPGTLKFRRFLEPMPSTPEELSQLQDDLKRIQLYDGTLVSYDQKGTSVLVGAAAGMNRGELYRTIQDIIAAKGPIPERIDVIGAPVAEALLGTHILEDLGVPSAILGARVGSADETPGWRMPRSLHELRLLIARHIGLVPLAITVMVLVFVVSFRSLTAALLPMTEVGACLAVVFGLMGWFGVPVYLTIAVLPVILTAIGVADEIHIFSRYAQELRGGASENHTDAVRATMDEMWAPVVKTSVTTAVGFMSFALSPIGPVRAFGVFTAVGIVFCMLWSLTVIPALLVLIAPGRFVGHRRRGAEAPVGAGSALLGRLATAVVRRRRAVLAVTVLVAAAASLGLSRVTIQDSWIDGFSPESSFRQATHEFNEQFLGTHLLLVCVDTGHGLITGELDLEVNEHYPPILPGTVVADPQELVGQYIHLRPAGEPEPAGQAFSRRQRPREWSSWIEAGTRQGDEMVITAPRKYGILRTRLRLSEGEKVIYEITPRRLNSPEVLRLISDLEAFIETRRDCAVGGVVGTADYMATTHFMARAGKEEFRTIPDGLDRVAWLWGQYKRVRGPDRLRQVVDADFSRSLVTVFLKDANFVDTARLMEAIRRYERANLAPHGITLGFAGDVAVSQTLIGAIVSTQFWSLMVSLVGIAVVTSLLGRSLRWGLCCVLPCALAVLVNFAMMGWTGMPLGVATSMFAGMTLGIGVDFAIHFMERYRLARRRGLGQDQALADTLSVAGPAIVIDALGVALGFGIMTLSQVPANARLGALVVLSIVGCLAATLLVLPALIRVWPPPVPSPAANS